MNVEKITISIKVELFSKDSLRTKLCELMQMYETGNENVCGKLQSSDGDNIEWSTKVEESYVLTRHKQGE